MGSFFKPKLLKVEALEPYRLRTEWDTGETLEVDVEAVLRSCKPLAPILAGDAFRGVHIGTGGASIEWFDSEFGADNIYAWAKEQAGQPSHEMFEEWMYRNGLSLSGAAAALGMSRRMVAYYRTAARPIPRHVWLACLGWEAMRWEALPFPMPEKWALAAQALSIIQI